MANLFLKLKIFWLKLRYRNIQKKPGFEWSIVADMPLRRKELKRAVKRGLVETRQVRNGYSKKTKTEYRFNKSNMGKYFVNKSTRKSIKEKWAKLMRKKWKKKITRKHGAVGR
jgi:hypothetical protein